MRFILVLAIATLLCLPVGEVPVQASPGNTHASEKAYPGAVISATDSASGITVSVDPDGTGLTARDRSGRTLWQADVIREAGKPSEGRPVVRYVAIKAGQKVSIVVGKNRYVEADLRTGNVRLLGED